MIQTTQALGELATLYPGATLTFLRHRLDFCCGGRRSLGDACDALGLNTSAVIAELEALAATDSGNDRWDLQPTRELVAHILVRYHASLRLDLPALIAAAEKVERVHASRSACPRGLADHLHRVYVSLLEHMSKEEEVLFPALLSGTHGAALQMPIHVMTQEHDDHGVHLKRTRELADDFQAPEDACGTWRALYDGLAKLEAELMEHIHLENNVLFPRAVQA